MRTNREVVTSDNQGQYVVFLGPSLSHAEAAELCEAEYRPPVQRGDIYALIGSRVTCIAIVDGVFHNQASVWHREIIAAIDSGIRVYGCSSMGALRAVELQRYGMIGSGSVFEMYASGAISDDDEVAMTFAQEGHAFRSLSEPLVNWRATLLEAARLGILSKSEGEQLLGYLKSLPYSARCYAALKRAPAWSHISVERREKALETLRLIYRDLKSEDARELLGMLRSGTTVRERVDFGTPFSSDGPNDIELERRMVRNRSVRWWIARLHTKERLSRRLCLLARLRWFCSQVALHAFPDTVERIASGITTPSDGQLHRLGATAREWLEFAQLWAAARVAMRELRAIHGPRAAVRQLLRQWAASEGVEPPEGKDFDWLLEVGPTALGYYWNDELETFRELQFRDRFELLDLPTAENPQ